MGESNAAQDNAKQDEQTPAQDGQQQNEEENGGLEPIDYTLFDVSLINN